MNEMATDLEFSRADVENRLRRANVRCVFVAGQRSAAGHHFAFLVSEDDAARGRSATRSIAGVTVVFFTLAGAKSGGFRLDNPRYDAITLALFPLEIADYLLENAIRAEGHTTTAALDAFRVAAYLQAYFGGSARLFGLARGEGTAPDLRALAGQAGLDTIVCQSRATLDAYLADCGWRPPIDMLERLGLADPWIQSTLLPELIDEIAAPPGLTVYFLRGRAVKMGRLERMQAAIEENGFEILHSLPLRGETATHVRRSVRGGNWGAGPWPLNGGAPVHLLFAVDVFPETPDEATRAQHPFLDNRRILTGKIAARNAALSGLPSGRHFNALHSADNSAETLRFAETVLDASDFNALSTTFHARCAEAEAVTRNTAPVGGAGTVALSLRNEAALRKVYRHQYLDGLAHDAELLDHLAPKWPEIPTLLDRGATFLDLTPIGPDLVPLGTLRAPLPIPTVLRLRKILRAVTDQGFDPAGWDPSQGILISATTGDFRIPGFDRPERHTKPVPLERALCMTGPAQGQRDGYRMRWYPVLGMPRAIFLGGGPLAMYFYRIAIHPVRQAFAQTATAKDVLKANLRLPIRSLRRLLRKLW